MKAELFIQKLDIIRSAIRTQFGMKQNQVVFESKPVQDLIKLLEGLYIEGHKKHQAPRVAEEDVKLHELDQVVSEMSSAGIQAEVGALAKQPPMTHTPLPRDPKPVHPIEVLDATEATVVAPAGGWQEGDI